MFTGIVQSVGRIRTVTESAGAQAGVRLEIDAGGLDLSDVAVGDSIAIQGACMTVVECDATSFAVDVSRESLNCTAGLGAPGPVNLEKALAMGDKLGGHLVSGHVDGVGTVVRMEPVGDGEHWELVVRAPKELGKFLAYKGSITVNGVSLTVNSVVDGDAGTDVAINLIPHTLEATTLKGLRARDGVNLEIDLIARYVARMLEASEVPPKSGM